MWGGLLDDLQCSGGFTHTCIYSNIRHVGSSSISKSWKLLGLNYIQLRAVLLHAILACRKCMSSKWHKPKRPASYSVQAYLRATLMSLLNPFKQISGQCSSQFRLGECADWSWSTLSAYGILLSMQTFNISFKHCNMGLIHRT